jgi:hypothetical protein
MPIAIPLSAKVIFRGWRIFCDTSCPNRRGVAIVIADGGGGGGGGGVCVGWMRRLASETFDAKLYVGDCEGR